LVDDGLGVDEPLNEPGMSGNGLVVRGTDTLIYTFTLRRSVTKNFFWEGEGHKTLAAHKNLKIKFFSKIKLK
jgi:hypothetical protein